MQIAASGKVFAEIDTPALVIEDGATFEGSCSMSRETSAGPSGGQRSTSWWRRTALSSARANPS